MSRASAARRARDTLVAQTITQETLARRVRTAPAPAFPVAPEPLATRDPQPDPWPINESDIDLPSEPPPPLPGWADAPLCLGILTVTQRGIAGKLSLDVLLAQDGSSLDLGPYHLDRDNLQRLNRLTLVIHALIGHGRPPAPSYPAPIPGGRRHTDPPAAESGRGITGWDVRDLDPGWDIHPARTCHDLAQGGLGEGEGRP